MSTADALGFDAKIGGHDAMVALNAVLLYEEDAGRACPLSTLAEACAVEPEDLLEGVLARLARAGYVEVEGPDVPEDLVRGRAGIRETTVSPTDVGRVALACHLSAFHAFARHALGESDDAKDGDARVVAGGFEDLERLTDTGAAAVELTCRRALAAQKEVDKANVAALYTLDRHAYDRVLATAARAERLYFKAVYRQTRKIGPGRYDGGAGGA